MKYPPKEEVFSRPKRYIEHESEEIDFNHMLQKHKESLEIMDRIVFIRYMNNFAQIIL
jgi:hypothetical protein